MIVYDVNTKRYGVRTVFSGRIWFNTEDEAKDFLVESGRLVDNRPSTYGQELN